MDWGSRLLCSWPGLPGLWHRGYFSSLLIAVGFSILLNLALVSSFLWPRCLGEAFPVVAWPTVLILWMAAAFVAVRTFPALLSVGNTAHEATTTEAEHADTLFIEAQREYLRGHWQAAESLLERGLTRSPRDAESRLLLATLLRHTRRLDEAADQLDTMQKFDTAIAWTTEIQRERELLRLIAEHDANDDAGSNGDQAEISTNNLNDNELLAGENDGYVRHTVIAD
jgi:hypothetical protein